MPSFLLGLFIVALGFNLEGTVLAWPPGPPAARDGKLVLLLQPRSSSCLGVTHNSIDGARSTAIGQDAPLAQHSMQLIETTGCGGHGKCSVLQQECVCDPCWSGSTCTQYLDLHQPRFLVNNLYRVIARDVQGPIFRAEVTDDDLGLTCPLHGPGEATTCPCATVRFILRPGEHANLFSVDNETGDVFLAPGAVLLPGNKYHLTLEAHGLRVAGWSERPGRDVMSAVLYVSHDSPLESLSTQSFIPKKSVKLSGKQETRLKQHRRRKRQTNGARGLELKLVRISPPVDQPLHLGDALHIKVLLRLPTIQWSQQVTLELSSEQNQIAQSPPAFSLCGARVSKIGTGIRSSLGDLLGVRPLLETHPDYTSMFAKAVFNMGIVSTDVQSTIDNVKEDRTSIEITLESVLSNMDVADTIQYISANLRNGENDAQMSVNISSALMEHQRKQRLQQKLSVEVETVVDVITPVSPATAIWTVQPHISSADLTIALWDVTPGPAQFRVGGLSITHLDDGFYCLAVPKASLTPIQCLLNNDLIPRLLAQLYIPVYTRRTDSSKHSSIEFTSWMKPLERSQLATNSNVIIEARISSAGSEWHSQLNISLQQEAASNEKKTMSFISASAIKVTSLSTTTVPKRVPVLSEIALQLPKGMFNLAMKLTTLTKGVKPISLTIHNADSTIDQEALSNYKILRPSSRELIYQPTQFIFNSRDSSRLLVHASLAGDDDVATGAAVALFSVATLPHAVPLNITVQSIEPMIVTPKLSVVPYENERAFDERGLLGFGILMEIPGGTCTKTVQVEVNGRYEGVGEAILQLCGSSFDETDPGLSGFTTHGTKTVSEKVSPMLSHELGHLCAAKMLNSTDDQRAIYRVTYRLLSPINSTLDGEIRLSGRVHLGGVALWSGGVAIRVHRTRVQEISEHFSECYRDTSQQRLASRTHACPT